MAKKLTQEMVLERFKETWGDRYDYSNVEYKNQEQRVEITCLKKHWKTGVTHGSFQQKPIDHWLGKQGCDECKADAKRQLYLKSHEEFLEDAHAVHGDYYDYSLAVYQGAFEPIVIICPIHINFTTTPDSHINAKSGCSKCGDERGALKNATPFEVFEKRAKRVHEGKYTYSQKHYKTGSRETRFHCPKHGFKWQLPSVHAKGHGCKDCGIEAVEEIQRLKQEADFIRVLTSLYGKKYAVTGFFLKKYSNGALRRWASLECDEHDPFDMPCSSLKSQGSIGCKDCEKRKIGDSNRKSTQEFIAKATLLHNGFYDYSETVYKSAKSKISYGCPIHGLRTGQTADAHLRPSGCRKCADEELVGRLKEDSYPPKEPYGIYLLELENVKTREKYLKVGLSRTSVKQRMAHLQKDYEFKVLANQYNCYSEVFRIADEEWVSEIKSRDLQKVPKPKLQSGGNTECSEYNGDLALKYTKKINDLQKTAPVFVLKR